MAEKLVAAIAITTTNAIDKSIRHAILNIFDIMLIYSYLHCWG